MVDEGYYEIAAKLPRRQRQRLCELEIAELDSRYLTGVMSGLDRAIAEVLLLVNYDIASQGDITGSAPTTAVSPHPD